MLGKRVAPRHGLNRQRQRVSDDIRDNLHRNTLGPIVKRLRRMILNHEAAGSTPPGTTKVARSEQHMRQV